MPEITEYETSYYSMTWDGARGYPEDTNAGRCYITGMLGMLRHFGEPDVLFADGTSGDGFSFRWCPAWGAPAFNGGEGPFHRLWEYTPAALGAPGMARCAEAIRRGQLKDIPGPDGKVRKLFVHGNIPNHGVLGRAGAAGYLRRVARELGARGLNSAPAAAAAERMQESSHLFRKLRYEDDLIAAGDLLGRIADCELAALDLMDRAWPEVQALR